MNVRPHPFTLRQLQYVVAVADLLSFRRAAERCRVSQPSLSAQLAQMEGGLNIRIFERDRRRVLVTPAGAALVAHARAVLLAADDLLRASEGVSDPLAGRLRVGVIPTISPYWLPVIAPALRQAFPRLTLAWREDKTEVLVHALETGELEAALLALEADIPDVERALIAEDPFVLAMKPDHPLAKKTTAASAADLGTTEVLLLDDGHCFRTQALALCSATRAREAEYRATSLATLVQMVASGAGVTLLPAMSVATEAVRAGLVVRPLSMAGAHRTIALVWRKRAPQGAALRSLADVMKRSLPAQAVSKQAKKRQHR